MENSQNWVKPEIILIEINSTEGVPKFTGTAENTESHS